MLILIAFASSEGSYVFVHPRSLTRVLASRLHQNMEANGVSDHNVSLSHQVALITCLFNVYAYAISTNTYALTLFLQPVSFLIETDINVKFITSRLFINSKFWLAL